jgi:hypothetical protein
MRAVMFRDFKTFPTIENIDVPEPGPGEVLLKVEESPSDLMDLCSRHHTPPAVQLLTNQQGHDLAVELKARVRQVLPCWRLGISLAHPADPLPLGPATDWRWPPLDWLQPKDLDVRQAEPTNPLKAGNLKTLPGQRRLELG